MMSGMMDIFSLTVTNQAIANTSKKYPAITAISDTAKFPIKIQLVVVQFRLFLVLAFLLNGILFNNQNLRLNSTKTFAKSKV